MLVIRRITEPGARQYSSSSFEIQITPEEVIGHGPPYKPGELQEILHVLFRETQLSVLVHATMDGVITQEEFSRRWAAFDAPLPDWLTKDR